MGKTAIIYGSTTGTTENIAGRIAEQMNIASEDVYEVAKITPADVAQYDMLLLGCSTWGAGDLQDDWYKGLEMLKQTDLTGKKIAFFGAGDHRPIPIRSVAHWAYSMKDSNRRGLLSSDKSILPNIRSTAPKP